MIQAKCIEKFRDKSNKIIGYKLVDLNNRTQDFTPEILKNAIANKKIHVVNLTLTSDGRLMPISDKSLPYREKDKTTKNVEQQRQNNDIIISDLAKAFTLIEWSYIDMGDDIEEVVNCMCKEAGITENAWDIPEVNGVLKLLNRAHQVILNKNPGLLTTRLKQLLTEEGEYYGSQIKNYMYSEGVSKLNDSKTYKAVYLVYKSFKDKDKKLAKIIKEQLLDDMKQNGIASIKVGYEVGHEYFRYLDETIFGLVTNDYFTVGHVLTTDEKKEFKELKPYSYKCSKDFNILSHRPEVGITFLFKNSDKPGKIDVDVKMHRTGYVSKYCVKIVGYIKDLGSFTLDTNNKDNAKIVGQYCNKIGVQVKEFCNKNENLLRVLPLGAEVEYYR